MATDASFVLVAGYSLLYRVVHLLLRRNTLFLHNNSPLAIWLAPLLSSCHWQLRFSPVSCFVFGFGTGYCGSALRLQKSHRFFWIFGGMANPLQRIYNEYEIQIGVESAPISVSLAADHRFRIGTQRHWFFFPPLWQLISTSSDPLLLRPVLRHRSSDGRSNPLGVFLLPAPAEP